MTTSFLIGIALYFCAVMVSRIYLERAMRTLDDTQKATLMSTFSSMRIYSVIPLFILFLVYYLISQQSVFISQSSLLIYWLLLVVYLIAVQWFSSSKLKRLSLPTEFNRPYGISRACSLIGLALIVSVVIYHF